ncbi:hypothetical protein EDB81DRAFT_667810 [Dactylonectria macrodidyma]|uniref:RBR-type E3 ubiquitin transferase n=1 Tax=Dactylonectria macrodidyma TaxID=307937 RepID=A0A9P9DGB7_9HYPO|nr:hypothetical protein EDB81DRAFT_667810 [Dactylonectria macrodidyma]
MSKNDNDPEPARTESSTSAASYHTTSEHEDHRECVICENPHSPDGVVNNPCSHDYRHSCLVDLVKAAIRDESLFPPPCCGKPVPVDANSSLLPHQILKDFVAKKLEYGTKDRTYCHRPACSAFIPPDAIANAVATCVECKHKTCVTCKTVAHGGDCPKDAATQQLLRVAKDEGWQQCPSCKRMVELDRGRAPNTCICRAQFCYLCAKPWKTCPCRQWDESGLLARAEVIVGCRPGGGQLTPAQRQEAIRRARDAIRRRQNCPHADREWRHGGGTCDHCGDEMHTFLFLCHDCDFQACR